LNSAQWIENQIQFRSEQTRKNDKLVVKLNIQIGVLIKTNKHKHRNHRAAEGEQRNLFLNTISLLFAACNWLTLLIRRVGRAKKWGFQHSSW